MSAAGWLLFGIFASMVVLILALPYLNKRAKSGTRQPFSGWDTNLDSLANSLQAEYQAVLITVRDLDMDYQTGKLNESDYLDQRERQLTFGADLLRQIEAQAKGTEAKVV